MKSQQIEIIDSEVTGDPRPAPEGKWIIGGSIEIPSKYLKERKFELRLNDFENSFVITFMSFLKPRKYCDTEFVNSYFLFTTIFRGGLYSG